MKFELDQYRHRVTNTEYLEDIKRVATLLKRRTLSQPEYRDHGRYHPKSISRRFGSWPTALKEAGLDVGFRQNVPREDALADLRKVASEMGVKTLSCSDYLIRGRYSEKPLIRAFGSWNSALAAAGLVVGKRAKIKDEDLFDNITRMWQTLGRQPRYREVEPPLSEVSVGTYEHRFGSWRKALEAFVQSVSVGSATERPQPQESPVVKARPQRRRATRRNPNWRMRYLVLSRDGFRCVLCGASPATAHGVKLHVDHITPWSKGGETILSNLRTCCEQCNIGRSNLDASPLTV